MSGQACRWQIRAASGSDLQALVALDSIAATDPQRARQIAGWLAEGAVWVAEHDGELAGYLALHAQFFGEAFIAMLMVAAPRRGHGVGTALLAHAAACSAGAKLFTSCNHSNAAMQRLLAATGFQQCGIVHGLDEGDPELIFRYSGG